MELSSFHHGLRLYLGDATSIAGTNTYSDTQLNDTIKTIFKMGLAPAGLSVDEEANTISPDPNPDQFGFIILKSAESLIGGEEIYSYRTPSMSVTRFVGDKKVRLAMIKDLMWELQERGNLGDNHHGASGMFLTSEACLTRIEADCLTC